MSLSQLFENYDWPNGSWFVLSEADIGFSERAQRPCIFPHGTDSRHEFSHALPRTTREPSVDERAGEDFVSHGPHDRCDANACKLDRHGWIRAIGLQVTKDAVERGDWSCTERLALGKIQTLFLEAELNG